MKTTMQELIDYLEARYLICKESELTSEASTILMTIGDAKLLLEKEKEQIIEAGNGGVLINFLHREKLAKMSDDELRDSLVQNTTSYGEMYYNQTYNQNK